MGAKVSLAKKILEDVAIKSRSVLGENKLWEKGLASKNERLMKEAAEAAEARKLMGTQLGEIPHSDSRARTPWELLQEQKLKDTHAAADKVQDSISSYNKAQEAEIAARKSPGFAQPDEATRIYDEPTKFMPEKVSKPIKVLKMRDRQLLEQLNNGTVHFTTESGSHLKPEMTAQKIKDTIKQLRAEGIEARATKGEYGYPENSIMVKLSGTDADEAVLAKIRKYAADTGQESIAVNRGGKSTLEHFHGDKAGQVEELGEGFSLLKERPADGNFTKYKTVEGDRYVRLGTGEKPAVHYSDNELTTLDPAYAGKGVDERKFMKQGVPETKTMHAYEGIDVPPEDLLAGKKRHTVMQDPKKLYDFNTDPENFMGKAREAMRDGKYEGNPVNAVDLAKKMAKEKGYEGIRWEMDGQRAIQEYFGKKPAFVGAVAAMPAAGALGQASSANGGAPEGAVQKLTSRAREIASGIGSYFPAGSVAPNKALDAVAEAKDSLVGKIVELTGAPMLENPYVPKHAKDFYKKATSTILNEGTNPINYMGPVGPVDAAIGAASAGYDIYNQAQESKPQAPAAPQAPQVSYVDSNPIGNPTQTFNLRKP